MFNRSVLDKLDSLDPSNARYFLRPTLSLSDKETYYVSKSHFAVFTAPKDKLGSLTSFSDIFTLEKDFVSHVFPGLSVEEKGVYEKPDFYVVPNSLTLRLKKSAHIPTTLRFLKEAGVDAPSDLSLGWINLHFSPPSEGYVPTLLMLKMTAPEGVTVFERRVSEPTYFY